MTKCRSGVGAARCAQVRYDSNFSLRRLVPSQRPRTGGRQRVVADFDGERTAEEMNRAVAVICSRLGVS